ncbi:MAG TPA: helix-turn-helix domain-containing protein [Steroidobacteraceae bacterium]|nr:helix-turn-helix domain-containing protein [Steroidobacteraceae bacterium]
MSSDSEAGEPRLPKRARGKERVAKLLQAATAVFAEKGYEAATMTEIAARAGAPIGSLYQFFPVKAALADTLVQSYIALLAADLQALEARADRMDTQTLVEGLLGLLRAHPKERAAAQPLAEARKKEEGRRPAFRRMLRGHIAAILRARAPTLGAEAAREMAIVMLTLMKASSMLSDEEGLPGRAAGLRELRALAVQYLDQRLPTI